VAHFFYCEVADVGSRLGLDSAQRTRANNRIESCIRRSAIDIDQMFRDYGRDVPSTYIADSTLNGAITAGATTITLTDASSFSTSGNGDIDGDSFKWTGKSSNDLTGCTGISFDHNNNAKVHEGEMSHVLKEICADLAASYYLEDESMFQTTTTDGSLRSSALRERGERNLMRLAHLGSVD
jgi:hypothetical protein